MQDVAPHTMLYNGHRVPDTCVTDVFSLAVINAHPRDKHIAFEEKTHKYYVKGSADGFISTTGVAHEYFEDFDAVCVATRMVQRADIETAPRYAKYRPFLRDVEGNLRPLQDRVASIVESWEENGATQAALGTAMHRYIELDYNGEVQDEDGIDPDAPELDHYRRYAQKQADLGYEPYRTEWMLWDEPHKLAGTIDMMYRHPVRGTIHMVDWKRSREIKKFGFRRGTGPCSHLQDCNYVHYCIQLNTYKWMLEKNYGIKVEDMHIAVFHPNNDNYLEYEIPDMQDLVAEIMAIRGQKLGLISHPSSPPSSPSHPSSPPSSPSHPSSPPSSPYPLSFFWSVYGANN